MKIEKNIKTKNLKAELSAEKWWNKDIQLTKFKVKDKFKAQWYSQLQLLVQSGFDLGASLELLKNEASGKWKEQQEIIFSLVVKGQLLSEVLSESTYFSAYESESIKIGEESGRIQEVLYELGKFYERKIELRRKFINVMMYPVIIVLVSIAVIAFMLRIVVPMFQDMFKRFDAELPSLTKFVIRASEWTGVLLPFLILIIPIAWFVIRYFKNNKRITLIKEKIIFKIPKLGSFTKKNLQARFCQNMKLLLGTGTNLTKSLRLTKNMLNNEHYNHNLDNVLIQIEEGGELHLAMKDTGLFEPRVISLVRVGEEINKLDIMFEKLEEQFTQELEYESKQLSALLEPIVILTLGTFVGVILVAMYLPILDMSKIVR